MGMTRNGEMSEKGRVKGSASPPCGSSPFYFVVKKLGLGRKTRMSFAFAFLDRLVRPPCEARDQVQLYETFDN